jgi:hypothetical protein
MEQSELNLKAQFFEMRFWFLCRTCPGRVVSDAYANLQQEYTRFIKGGSTKLKEDENKDLQSLAFTISVFSENQGTSTSCHFGSALNPLQQL